MNITQNMIAQKHDREILWLSYVDKINDELHLSGMMRQNP